MKTSDLTTRRAAARLLTMALLALLAIAGGAAHAAFTDGVLRVCADPDNMPF